MIIWVVSIATFVLGVLIGFAAGRPKASFENGPLKLQAATAKDVIVLLEAMSRIGASALQSQVLAEGARTQSAQPQPRAM
jgi:hypothetical protein